MELELRDKDAKFKRVEVRQQMEDGTTVVVDEYYVPEPDEED